MNFIGIDVSQGKSHATQITDEFEKRTFAFNHITLLRYLYNF